MSDKFQRFGKYLILDHLVDGGMAKICRARFLGEQANKLLAIKMVQPQFSKDPAFVQMFEDELKVTFGLQHPNIVQLTDYGLVDGQLYSAMEYVDGANLKEFLDRLKEKNFVFPVEISTYIISQVCQALHYAHTFTDKLTGTPFNIIHRDISPHNIMLTYDGAVKVIDFGIAKADSNSEATQAGTIKGKLSYLAPEYLDGLELDPRYDLFAVGITLWELLCSRKLFKAANDLAVLKEIQACKIPRPSSINPNVPKELDEIVLKALAKDRNDRYDNMDQFNRALVKFLYSTYPDFNATDLGYFAKQLFKPEIEADKKKFVEYGKIDITPYIRDLQNHANSSSPSKQEEPKLSHAPKLELDFNFDENSTHDIKIEKNQGAVKSPFSSSKGTKVVAANRKIQTSKTKINANLKSKQSQKTSWPFRVAFVAAVFALSIFKSDVLFKYTGVDLRQIVGLKGEISAKSKRKLAATNSEFKKGTLTLVNYDATMKVFLNGSEVKVNGIDLEVNLNEDLQVTVFKRGYKRFVANIVRLDTKNLYGQVIIPELEQEKVGLLSTSLNFTSGSKLILTINGEQVEKDLPFENYTIPVGRYPATIFNPLLGSKRKVNIEITENRKHILE
ncbi:MAG: serine/threonine protein kinase [Bacteriovoracaceae bacterium]|jgi:serine/threonine-protein kinase|nr:serine/threonine protein kinase [Bacteriovoracaceae bacterium]